MKSSRIAISIVLVLLLIWLFNRTSSIGINAVQTAKPALETANRISIRHPKLTENQKLEAKIKILEARLSQMEELSLENERLRKLLDFQKNISHRLIPAEVIARDPSNWTSVVFLDKGRNDNIEPGMGVTTASGIAGKVIDVGEDLAKVMLINDPDSRIAGRIQRSREEGLVCGTLSHSCRMIYLSVDADVKIGDMVVTSGSSKVFSEGLPIGEIVDLFEDKGGLYRSAVIRPSADLKRLEEVLCIK